MKNISKKTTLLLLLILIPFILNSEELNVKSIGYSVDLPEKWKVMDDANPSIISFKNPSGTAIFQVFSFNPDAFSTSTDIFNHIKNRLNANGDSAKFNFSGSDSVFSFLSFNAGKYKVKGYFVFINGNKFDFALLSFSQLNSYEANHDFLLSILDSFSPDNEGKLLPGPVSQFYYTGMGKNQEAIKLIINKKIFETFTDKKEIEATQVLVEREARILSKYKNDPIKAWQRYYRMIYRDNYQRLKELADHLIKETKLDQKNSTDIVKTILLWIQKFKYTRTKTLSDLTPPLASLFTLSGDCDSRALLFVILLHHLKIDSILLVSSKYKHSAVGINIEGDGARLTHNGQSYLYTEVTEEVEIGLVPKKMADLSAWIPIQLGHY